MFGNAFKVIQSLCFEKRLHKDVIISVHISNGPFWTFFPMTFYRAGRDTNPTWPYIKEKYFIQISSKQTVLAQRSVPSACSYRGGLGPGPGGPRVKMCNVIRPTRQFKTLHFLCNFSESWMYYAALIKCYSRVRANVHYSLSTCFEFKHQIFFPC